MKNFLLASVAALGIVAAGAASAADLPSRKGPIEAPIYVPVFTWTGFYVGANAGYAWGQVDSTALGVIGANGFGGFGSFEDPDGFVGGGQIGYNYQIGQWVVGLEADFQGADLKATAFSGAFTASNEMNWFGTVRGRVGYAFDRFLPYVTGGFAYGNVKNKITHPTFGAFSDDNTQYGWTIGGGLEYAFTNNLTAKLEYLYVDLDKESVNVPGGTFTSDIETQFSVVRAGLNYKF